MLNRRVDLHAIDATPARWRGDVGSSPLDGTSAATSSPRNDLVKNCRVHPTHWLISTQVGRGLYISNLDWWYASHNAEDILVVCSEDLNDLQKAAREMSRVAAHIGLSPFDFSEAVSRGKYNAGAQHKGYGVVTSWKDASTLSEKRPAMSTEARLLINNFTAPFNERLFLRAGHRCRWGHEL